MYFEINWNEMAYKLCTRGIYNRNSIDSTICDHNFGKIIVLLCVLIEQCYYVLINSLFRKLNYTSLHETVILKNNNEIAQTFNILMYN